MADWFGQAYNLTNNNDIILLDRILRNIDVKQIPDHLLAVYTLQLEVLIEEISITTQKNN